MLSHIDWRASLRQISSRRMVLGVLRRWRLGVRVMRMAPLANLLRRSAGKQ